MNSIRNLRTVALLEATSFLALLVASYIKHEGNGAVGVSVLGPIHGALFILYVVLALSVRKAAGWSTATTVWILVGAVVPFGGYVVDVWLMRNTPKAQPEG